MKDIYLKPIRNVAARGLGDETIVMALRNSRIFSLNETASVIWNAADGSTPLAEITALKIVPAFDVGPDDAYRDARELVEALAAEGILLISDRPIIEDVL